MAMQLRFDPSLPHQQEAIQAVTDLFHGMPLANNSLSFSYTAMNGQSTYGELGVGNAFTLEHGALVRNLHEVQQRNRIQQSLILDQPRFSIEMETGTGKTYVYLRTMFELNKRYGMKKFVIVVPSIAIREGVLHSIGTMRSHFESLYDIRFEHFVYDSERLAAIRSFATSDMMQIMVINIQSFISDAEKKDTGRGKGNVIYREYDKLNGYAPIDFIAATAPIVVVDEPQRASSSEKQRAAIERLKPSLVLEYSATHKDARHLVYRLGPIDAFEQNLVKQIEVASVIEDDAANSAYISFVQSDIKNQRTRVEITHGTVSAPKRKKVWLKHGIDLADESPNRPEYAQGYLVTALNWEPGWEAVEFGNGVTITPDSGIGEDQDSVLHAQMEVTIRKHLDNELRLREQGIKVLSLFFIDRVANYRDYDAEGVPRPGKFAIWFEEIYADLMNRYARYRELGHADISRLHDGYFSIDKQGRIKDTRGDTRDDESTYAKIMRNKERLLSESEPLRFIFSHSALREGWDNPNVFQICTLNETNSAIQKRQEIGRGLRLPVNQFGERIHDRTVNRLTVVANESYKAFAEMLQREYEEEAGVRFGVIVPTTFNKIPDPYRIGERNAVGDPVGIGQQASESIYRSLIHNGFIDSEGRIQDLYNPNRYDFKEFFAARIPETFRDEATLDRVMGEINKQLFRDRIVKPARTTRQLRVNEDVIDNERFLAFWNTIAQKTRYLVAFDTDQLTAYCVESIRNMARIRAPQVRVEIATIEQSHAGVRELPAHYVDAMESRPVQVLPDVITMVQSETNLTRRTIARILAESGRLEDFERNPQAYITSVLEIIKNHLNTCLLGGLHYEKVEGDVWHVRELSHHTWNAVEDELNPLFEPAGKRRTVYDRISLDSGTERTFVEQLDADERVKYYVKLPGWFTIDTPIGQYNPDWAIMYEDEKTFDLVRETKSTTNEMQRRGTENAKIQAARRHYDAIGVNYGEAITWPAEVLKLK